ncbi:MAG TPA: DUF86 domain-containing protein [Gammaproteobacteria bacterium]|nr:DUF86 domain-containing protein [Gammaproteobacteria bacterium]
MSDKGKTARAWSFYIDDMIGFAEKVLAYTQGMDQHSFCDSGITYDAVMRNLELIGEAAGHIPETVRDQHPEIPWRIMVATRNRLIHAYLGIDDDIIWSIIQDDIPDLLASLKKLKQDSAED